jgi:WhiB family redox-sensing transcriptional regulator
MPVPVSAEQANLQVPTRDAGALGPRDNGVQVLEQTALEPFDSCAPVARPNELANAACREMGPEFFFPADCVGLARARSVCARCRVAAKCLAIALDDSSLQGVWSGTSARDRHYLRSEEGLGWG